jgi:hypothetical protein
MANAPATGSSELNDCKALLAYRSQPLSTAGQTTKANFGKHFERAPLSVCFRQGAGLKVEPDSKLAIDQRKRSPVFPHYPQTAWQSADSQSRTASDFPLTN